MKRLISTVAMVFAIATVSVAQCNVMFSYAAYFNTVNFINQSTVSNAHYFWNFGDGTGSNFTNPVHTFPESGDYIVTLFAKDTFSKCASYYEYEVNVTKYSSDPCQPSISDSISTRTVPLLYIYTTSQNCALYSLLYSGAGGEDFPYGYPIQFTPYPFRMVCIGQYYDTNNILRREAFKTAFYHYSSSHNYGDSSANFEFKVVSKSNKGERILFTPMNKMAKSYEWHITGFGNPIISNSDTISQFYPYNSSPPPTWQVGLVIQSPTGYHDTIWQEIYVGDSSNTTLGVNDLTLNNGSIKVYPNPSNGIFTLSLSNITTKCNIEIYNVLDQQVYQSNINSDNTEINLSGQPQGIYLYRVITETGELIGEGKILIQ